MLMTPDTPLPAMTQDRLFCACLIATIATSIACIALQLLPLFPAADLAWGKTLEPFLVATVIVLSGLTALAAFRHLRRSQQTLSSY
ncbi:hypothetical protein HOP52_09865 [Halomonas campisalis]|uniref:Uncharacterized protein n=1 Tax=Billgrantia campisalis TaxID=74661 RepID=A0ABS9P8F5_9GAMM|nr:hypothetical protein [Halomonas campisalis]MCG6658060.1 hypothetical protein [Halomonas campisalis]MDR5862726.1 hypothetical protein [Halomonas campisalis]